MPSKSRPATAHRLPESDALATAVGDAIVGSKDGVGIRLGIVCARFNPEITMRLLTSAKSRALSAGVREQDLTIVFVPGAFELALAAQRLARRRDVDGVVCLGAVIRGETSHYDIVCCEVASGCTRVQLDTGTPVAFGVLTTNDVDQALARSGGDRGDKGIEAVETALEMIHAIRAIEGVDQARVGFRAGFGVG